jgi:hypothetical protein
MFIANMIKLIQDFQRAGHAIVLLFDANEAVGEEALGIERILLTCRLLNAHSLRSHGPTPPTFARGSKTIDHIFISPHLRDAVVSVYILPLLAGNPHDDHRIPGADFHADILFGGPKIPIVPPSMRRLTSPSGRQVHQYRYHLVPYMAKHRLTEKVIELNKLSDDPTHVWNQRDTDEWETLDALMTEGMLGAEAWCNLKKSGAPPWSPELALAAATLRYWNLRLKEVDIRDSSDDALALEHLAAHIGLPLAEHRHYYDLSALAQRKRSASVRLKAMNLAAMEYREKCLAQNAALFGSLHGFSSKNAAKAILAREKSSSNSANSEVF